MDWRPLEPCRTRVESHRHQRWEELKRRNPCQDTATGGGAAAPAAGRAEDLFFPRFSYFVLFYSETLFPSLLFPYLYF